MTTAALLVSTFSLLPEFVSVVSLSCDVILRRILAFIIALLFLFGAPEQTHNKRDYKGCFYYVSFSTYLIKKTIV